MGEIGVVFDTNVVVSAFGFGGTPLDALLTAITLEAVQLYASESTLQELSRVLAYERLPITDSERTRILDLLRREATVVSSTVDVEVVDRDPDDDAFLECASAADATYVVSGDDHLHDVGTFRDIEIVSPGEFLSAVE